LRLLAGSRTVAPAGASAFLYLPKIVGLAGASVEASAAWSR
jgi:hypothetical protein